MRTLGKFVVMTNDELDKIKDSAYLKGLRSKWKAAKRPILSVTGIPVHPYDNVTDLLSAIDDSVVLPQRAA